MAVKRNKKLKEKIIIGVSILLIVISIIAVAFAIIWNSKLFNTQKGDDFDPTTNSNYIEDVFVSTQEQINFLVVGVDVSEALSDVIIVISVDVKKKTAQVLQIPRDCYVSKTISTGKINSMYSLYDKDLKPIERIRKVLLEQFQLPIDYYCVINLEAFRNTVDAIGGIPINLPETIQIDGNLTLKAGEQVLDGVMAEGFVRHRDSYVEGDIGRVKAQRLFLASALQKVKGLGLRKIVTNVIPEVYDQIASNMTVKEMVDFSKLLFEIDMENIKIHMIPGEGYNFKNANGKTTNSVFAIHAEETAKLLNEYFRPYSDEVQASDLQIIRLANTGQWYENTDDDFIDLIDGVKPGQKNEDSSSESDSSSSLNDKNSSKNK